MKSSARFSISLLFLAGLSFQSQPGTSQTPTDHSRELVQPAGRVEAAKHQLNLDPPAGPQPQKLNPAKLRDEADELSKLAQSVPSDIDQVAQGKLPKEMADKLKRIEKLSKHLRSQLTQQ